MPKTRNPRNKTTTINHPAKRPTSRTDKDSRAKDNGKFQASDARLPRKKKLAKRKGRDGARRRVPLQLPLFSAHDMSAFGLVLMPGDISGAFRGQLRRRYGAEPIAGYTICTYLVGSPQVALRSYP